jgi:hypothetical protein
MKMNNNLQPAISELHKAFDLLNEKYYEGALPQVVIAVQAKGKSNAYGWFTVGKVWETAEGPKHEVTITAEFLNRDYIDIMRTLHHEMIHLYCHTNEIQDTSRGGTYHNKRFKAESEARGFYYEEKSPDKKYGWSFSSLTPETIEEIEKMDINKEAFTLARLDLAAGAKKKKKSNIVKWKCGCDVIIRSSKPEINVICGDCGTRFEKDEG